MYKDNTQIIEILLIEDDPGDVDLTREVLERSKIVIKLTVFDEGEEALAYLNQKGEYANAQLPDLILLDLNLPGLSGRDILEEIRNNNNINHLPVVVLTTSDADEDILKTYKLGANCYVTKPVGLKEFQKIVNTIELFWFSVVKLPR
ncbi:MAG: response regulator [Coleofasciculaceae cyanobacterium]